MAKARQSRRVPPKATQRIRNENASMKSTAATAVASSAAARTRPVMAARPVRVMATQLGYYKEIRRREGDVFTIDHPKEFSEKWMQAVAPSTPERVTSAPQALKREHDRILNERIVGGAVPPAGTPLVHDEEPTGAGNPLGALV